MKFIVDDPNFSVIMPGGCNASCDFCFYEYQKDTELLFDMWQLKLENELHKLPAQFKQVSITGGEPTINPGNLYATAIYLRKRFDKVVLTTNGSDLRMVMALVKDGLIDYINISRHSYDTAINEEIFKSNKVPGDKSLREFIEYSHNNGVPVTINCVDTKKLRNFHFMIDYCSEYLKAYAVKFRHISKESQLNKLPSDYDFSNHKTIYKESTGYI